MIQKAKSTVSLFLVLSLILTGCSLAPPHVRPTAPIPQDWNGSRPGEHPTTQPEILPWHQFILDSELKELIQTALEENRNLRLAMLKVASLKARYRIQDSERLPTLALDGSTDRSRSDGETSDNHTLSLGISGFELDFWGRVQNLSQAALQEYLATRAAGNMARITLISEVCQAYIRRMGAKAQYDLILATLKSRETALEIMVQRRLFGTASDLDYQEALSLREQARASLEAMARQVAQANNALDLLVGKKQNTFRTAAAPNQLFAHVPANLSSTILLQRPDIMAAEHRLMARNAEIGAARAAFFPRITLTTQTGFSNAQLSDLFQSDSATWQFMPRLTLPIFNHGKLKASLNLIKVRKDMAIVEYEKAIQEAFRQVADNLIAQETLKREETHLTQLVHASARSLNLAKLRYEQGIDNHLRYLDAQRADLANQTRLIQIRTQHQMAIVKLFTSLGGG